MNVKGLALVLTVILKVVSVESVCDDYLSCLGSFFNVFFNEKDKPPPLDSVIAQNSKSHNVNVDTKELDQILHDVSEFLREELDVQSNKELKSMLFREIHNDKAIYVKTFDISEDYLETTDTSEEPEAFFEINSQYSEKSTTTNPDVVNSNISIYENTFHTETTEVYVATPTITNLIEKVPTPNVLTTETLKFNFTKDEQENVIDVEGDSDLYYDSKEDNATDYPIIDYIEFYKDTTNEYINLEPTVEPNGVKNNMNSDMNSPLRNTIINSVLENRTSYAGNIDEEFSSLVFPWIAAIFVKNSSSDQFNYYCDGALLSSSSVLTAASCVQANNSTLKADDLIVLFGKTSLKVVKENEKAARIKHIKLHEKFSVRNQGNDLAILLTEEPVIFSDGVHAAKLGGEAKEDQLATTGWAITGELTPILLETREKMACGDEAASADTVCAVYGNDITVCPSYGSLYVTKQDTWYLQGIRTGNPEDRGLCINRDIAFTSLNSHWEWIKLHAKYSVVLFMYS